MTVRSEVDLGHALRVRREALSVTQSEVARKAGLRQKTISDAEQSGGTAAATLFALLAALGLDLTLTRRAASDVEPEAY